MLRLVLNAHQRGAVGWCLLLLRRGAAACCKDCLEGPEKQRHNAASRHAGRAEIQHWPAGAEQGAAWLTIHSSPSSFVPFYRLEQEKRKLKEKDKPAKSTSGSRINRANLAVS